MLERLSLYDLLVGIVPGALLLSSLAALFPSAAAPFRPTALPDEFAVVALLAASAFAGLVVQTIGSMLERPLHWAFRGRPSDRALDGTLGEKYLPADAAKPLEVRLRAHFGDEASRRALFLRAMSLAESTTESKAAAFNAQYGNLRASCTLSLMVLILLGASRWWGAAAAWRNAPYWTTVGVCLALLALFAWRTWQRGAYYAREVLLTADRLLDRDRPSTPA